VSRWPVPTPRQMRRLKRRGPLDLKVEQTAPLLQGNCRIQSAHGDIANDLPTKYAGQLLSFRPFWAWLYRRNRTGQVLYDRQHRRPAMLLEYLQMTIWVKPAGVTWPSGGCWDDAPKHRCQQEEEL
jgi:hypothetical protein